MDWVPLCPLRAITAGFRLGACCWCVPQTVPARFVCHSSGPSAFRAGVNWDLPVNRGAVPQHVWSWAEGLTEDIGGSAARVVSAALFLSVLLPCVGTAWGNCTWGTAGRYCCVSVFTCSLPFATWNECKMELASASHLCVGISFVQRSVFKAQHAPTWWQLPLDEILETWKNWCCC